MMREELGNYLMRFTANPFVVEARQSEGGYYEYITTCGLRARPLSDDLSTFLLLEIDGVIDRVEM